MLKKIGSLLLAIAVVLMIFATVQLVQAQDSVEVFELVHTTEEHFVHSFVAVDENGLVTENQQILDDFFPDWEFQVLQFSENGEYLVFTEDRGNAVVLMYLEQDENGFWIKDENPHRILPEMLDAKPNTLRPMLVDNYLIIESENTETGHNQYVWYEILDPTILMETQNVKLSEQYCNPPSFRGLDMLVTCLEHTYIIQNGFEKIIDSEIGVFVFFCGENQQYVCSIKDIFTANELLNQLNEDGSVKFQTVLEINSGLITNLGTSSFLGRYGEKNGFDILDFNAEEVVASSLDVSTSIIDGDDFFYLDSDQNIHYLNLDNQTDQLLVEGARTLLYAHRTQFVPNNGVCEQDENLFPSGDCLTGD